MDDIAERWAPDIGVTEMTDTDLTSSRRENTNCSDPSHELHRLCNAVKNAYDFSNESATLDYALRIEIAHCLNKDVLSFGREDFDVRYTIPPVEWLEQQDFDELTLPDENEIEIEHRNLNYSLPPVVFDMTARAVDEGEYETLSTVVITGLRRVAGKL